jgi:hypothetical protein
METHRASDSPDPDDFTDDSPQPDRDADLAALADALRDLGVARVTCRYEGCGDSGSVEEVEYTPESARPARALEDRLRVLAEAYCPEGYENNDGGYGMLTVHASAGLAELEHTDRWEECEDTGVHSATLPEPLRGRLAQLSVTGITADFDGYGDSGQIDSLVVEPVGVELDRQLADALEDFLMGLLPGGWENNEGGFGGFTIDVASARVEANASWRIDKESDTETIRWKWRQ